MPTLMPSSNQKVLAARAWNASTAWAQRMPRRTTLEDFRGHARSDALCDWIRSSAEECSARVEVFMDSHQTHTDSGQAPAWPCAAEASGRHRHHEDTVR